MEITSTKDVSAQYIKILIHGPAGSGKTRMCATTGKNTVILSAEGGLLSLADQAIDVMEIGSMEDLGEAYTIIQDKLIKDDGYEWVCLDSISEIAEVLLSKEKRVSKDPRRAYGELQDQMMDLMRGFRDLPCNIYFSAKQDRVKDEMTGGMIYGPSAPGQKVGPAMPYLFDLVFALHVMKNPETGATERWLQTERDAQYEAKDRSGKLALFEAPDLSAIAAKVLTNPKPKTKSKKKGAK